MVMREHLDLDDDADLLDPDRAAATIRGSAARLDAWYATGRRGSRPPGRLRRHLLASPARWTAGPARLVHRTRLPQRPRPRRATSRDETAPHLLTNLPRATAPTVARQVLADGRRGAASLARKCTPGRIY